MQRSLRTEAKMPYCPGCGHQMATNNIVKAIEKAGLSPLDVVVTTDIGCCGLLDPLLTCHTIHGLHGRSSALAMGVSLGLNNPDKKVIAVQGDGGATIGLQHLLEASRKNIDMTLIIQNNMVYGMTGGQISGLSAREFKAVKLPEESESPPYDICELAHKAGASYSARIVIRGDFSDNLAEAFKTKGFSVVELFCVCPSYSFKKISELDDIPYEEKVLKNDRPEHTVHVNDHGSLFGSLPYVKRSFGSVLESRIAIVIAGSAGESIQSAADLLAFAGMTAGLKTTKKGEYPITVGTGFSVAEVILSNEDINYTGIESPDIMIITSQDGLEKVRDRIGNNTKLIMDVSLDIPDGRQAVTQDFRKMSGRKGASLSAITYWLRQSEIFPVDALKEAAGTHKHADKLLSTIENILAL